MQVLRGLGHAHAAGVVHRDIKPANIMQLDHGAVKITDFGVARLGRQNVTHAGSIVGTPSYMAPEQLRGAAVDGRADLFAVGVIAYEALTGRRPFAGRSATEVMARILNDPHEPLDPGFAAFPPSLVRIIDKALAKDPAARFPSAAAFAQELEPALRDAARTSPAVVPDDATLIRGAPVPPPAPAAIGATAGMTLGGTPLDPAALSRIEQDLTRHLGPVAKVLVRKAAAGAGDLGEVYTRLAPNLPAEADRTRFLDLGRRHGGTLTGSGSTGIGGTGIGGTGIGVSGTGAGPSSPPTAARITLRPEAQARAEQALAKFMGPVARILVRQALVQAGSLRDFYAKLAAHIPREEDRAAFRRQLKEDWGPGFDR
jgi:serine/threonine-protein kinase